jgi:hypothetical protein
MPLCQRTQTRVVAVLPYQKVDKIVHLRVVSVRRRTEGVDGGSPATAAGRQCIQQEEDGPE